ncbi:MAG: sensor histidine kinase [Bacteroidia bacterium]
MKENQTLLINEETLRAIFNNAVDGMVVINNRGIIQTTNLSVSKMFQFSDDEMIGKNISMLMPEPDAKQHDSYLKNHIDTGEKKIIGIGREVLGKRKDGSTFPFFLSVCDVQLENGEKLYAGVLHDISVLKKAQKDIEDYSKRLEESNKDLQDFAYISSHDLQEPLRKVQAFADRIQKSEFAVLSDQGKDYLQRILNASKRMQRLINDLLELSRISAKQNIFQNIDLNIILDYVLEDLELLLESTHAKIHIEKLPIVFGDETQLRQLFQNLISNSVKFKSEERNPEIFISANFLTSPNHNVLEINFKDNGIGIEEKYSEKVYTVFQKLNGNKYEGSGIGLAVCKKIAIRHGGNITFTSQLGIGTWFKITLLNIENNK